jgi:PBP1b-binding outer membrane lipoprotein LpoB
MTRLMMAIAASFFALVLTGCGEDSKPAEPAATTTDAPAPAPAAEEQKPAEQGH